MSDTAQPTNSLWERVTALPRPFRIVPLPIFDGNGNSVGDVHMQVLTHQELMAARAAGERHVRDTYLKFKTADGKSEGSVPKKDEASSYEDLEANANTIEILYRSCRRVEDPSDTHSGPKWPAFPSPAEMRKRLTNDQVGVLMRAYLQVQVETGPIVASMSKEEVDAWIERVAKDGSTVPLASLSWGAASELILRMAYRLHRSSIATSSPGPLPDENSSDESDGDERVPATDEPPEES